MSPHTTSASRHPSATMLASRSRNFSSWSDGIRDRNSASMITHAPKRRRPALRCRQGRVVSTLSAMPAVAVHKRYVPVRVYSHLLSEIVPRPGAQRQARCLQQLALFRALGLQAGEPRLLVGAPDAIARDVEVTLFDFYPDEATAKVGTCYTRGARAHEGVEDGASIHSAQDPCE